MLSPCTPLIGGSLHLRPIRTEALLEALFPVSASLSVNSHCQLVSRISEYFLHQGIFHPQLRVHHNLHVSLRCATKGSAVLETITAGAGVRSRPNMLMLDSASRG